MRRFFGGRQPLCGIGVTSVIESTPSPAACRERIAASRPGPGPLTYTSTSLTPWSCAFLAIACDAICAAYGVLLRDPLKPAVPALSHRITSPPGSVNVMIVLLKVAWMYARARGTNLRSRRRLPPLLRRFASAIFPPSAPPQASCVLAREPRPTSWSARACDRRRSCAVHAWCARSSVFAALVRAGFDGVGCHDSSRSPSDA